MAKLRILSGTQEGTLFELIEERVTVGRASDNMICLPIDSVSTYHATFVRDGQSYRLRDLNSTNFTRVNGLRIVETTLNNGDLVRFGELDTRFEADVAPAPKPEPVQVAPTPVPPVTQPEESESNSNTPLFIGLALGLVLVIMTVAAAGFVLWWFLQREQTTRQKLVAVQSAAPESPPPVVVEPVPVAPVVPPKPVEEMSVKTEPKKTTTAAPPPVAEEKIPTAPVKTNVTAAPVTPTPALPEPKPVPATPQQVVTPFTGPPPVVKPNPYDGQAGVMASQNQIDQLVFPRLQQLGIQPASVCSDATFVRRVYFDVIGTLPTAEEVRAFLDDRNPNKRAALIDKLLERDEYADYWAMRWCDLLRVKSEFPINLWPNAVQTYHQWLRTCMKENRPYDRFARDLLTSSGSNFREAPVNFYRAVQSKDPQSLAQTVALTFMGTRAEKWPKEKLDGMAAFFSQVGYKSTSEWKEEIVFFDPGKATNATAKAVLPDGTEVALPIGKDPRTLFADWLITPSNPWFTRNIVNRIWSWLLGRGVIHEPDDIRPDNPPVIPELLPLLERELVANKYDMKSIFRLIMKSRTYQLSSVPRSNDPRAETHFAFYPVRRLEAEVMIDAINQITGTTERYSSPIPEPFTFIPENQRSITLADGSISSPFLELFGRSSRASGMEVERSNRTTPGQQLHLLNSSHIQNKIEQSAKLRALFQQGKTKPRGVIDSLYLAILSRYATDEESKVISAYSRTGDLTQRAGADLAWALMNSAEFQYRH